MDFYWLSLDSILGKHTSAHWHIQIRIQAQLSGQSETYTRRAYKHTIYSPPALVHAFILNPLDYCSSLCLGLPYVRLRHLDGVLIGGVSKFGHIGEFLRDTLHWLPGY